MNTAGTIGLGARRAVLAYLSVTGVVVALMMVFGLLMRLAQGGLLALSPDGFYRLMTAHGIGMVGIAGIGGAAIMWYFLSQYLRLSTGIFIANLVFFLAGASLILYATLIGGFAAGWTFLYPLPAQSQGVWNNGAAATYLIGVLLVGVGFLLLYLDTGRAILARYGSLGRALGWPQLFGLDDGEPPPPAVVAGTMVSFINVLALVVGAAILSITLINLYFPKFALNPLLAKNLIYFFGHTFVNSTIYMAIIAVYEILPRYTLREWKAGKAFLAAFTASTFMVLIVYPHHLLMDFAMPQWALWMGQIISYASGLPVLAVTAVGTLAIVHRSGIRWDLASGLLFLAVFGWAAGVLPAIIDGTIMVNKVMHNTLWVPGHFHFYLMLGMLAMVLGFMYYLIILHGQTRETRLDRAAFWTYAVAGLAFITVFLISGANSVPRRWAAHLPEWVGYDRIGAVFALFIVAAMLVFVGRFLLRLRAMAVLV